MPIIIKRFQTKRANFFPAVIIVLVPVKSRSTR